MNIPPNPKIYHITHINNLESIIQNGFIWSDAKIFQNSITCESIGMSEIKRRRLQDIEVYCHRNSKVGEYVPFYWCPRSVMLFIIHCQNNPDLVYRGGQTPILHLQADFNKVIEFAETNQTKWAFSDANAGAFYVSFYNQLSQLEKINWQAVESYDFRARDVKEGKQAEFLFYESFPWTMIEKIGVHNSIIKAKVETMIKSLPSQPVVSIEPTWYF